MPGYQRLWHINIHAVNPVSPGSYQWAEEYFRDPDAKEDQEKEEKFVPRAYSGKSSVKSKKTKTAAKKTAGKGKNVKTPEKKPQENVADEGQFEQMTLAGLAG